MKKLMTTAAALLASIVCVAAAPADKSSTASRLQSNKAQISLADAKSRTDKAIASPAVMKALMQHLSAADQKTFLADVNAAIATMPASDAERTAKFVAINRAALEGSKPGNVSTLVAESFATVSLASLPALCESLGSDLMNRATDTGSTYTDDAYLRVAEATMKKVNARTAEVDHGDVRSGFAALMLIHGSNTTKPEIVDPIIAMLPATAQGVAKKEWFPAALAEGAAKSYDPMLAAADVEGAVVTDVEELPNTDKDYWKAQGGTLVNLRVPGPVLASSLIFDIVGGGVDGSREISTSMPIYDALQTIDDLPAMDDFNDVTPVIHEASGGDRNGDRDQEPGGYQWQNR